jgi:hypothetical protein
MKIVYTVELDNRHAQDAYLLEACIKDAVVNFNVRTRAEAHVRPPRLFSDDFDDRHLYLEQRHSSPFHHPRENEP